MKTYGLYHVYMPEPLCAAYVVCLGSCSIMWQCHVTVTFSPSLGGSCSQEYNRKIPLLYNCTMAYELTLY